MYFSGFVFYYNWPWFYQCTLCWAINWHKKKMRAHFWEGLASLHWLPVCPCVDFLKFFHLFLKVLIVLAQSTWLTCSILKLPLGPSSQPISRSSLWLITPYKRLHFIVCDFYCHLLLLMVYVFLHININSHLFTAKNHIHCLLQWALQSAQLGRPLSQHIISYYTSVLRGECDKY